MKKRIVCILLVLVFLTALTPVSAENPFYVATVEKDGQTRTFFANDYYNYSSITALHEAFKYAGGSTATVTIHNDISLSDSDDPGYDGKSIVIDNPNSNITVRTDNSNVELSSGMSNPVFKVTAGSLTVSGLYADVQYFLEASGEGTQITIENSDIHSFDECDLCIKVSGGASLRMSESIIGTQGSYHTAIEVIGSPGSRTAAVIEGEAQNTIYGCEYAVSVKNGASVSVSGNTLLQATTRWAAAPSMWTAAAPPRSQAAGIKARPTGPKAGPSSARAP